MAATVSIYRRLLASFLPAIVALGAAIVLITVVGARQGSKALSSEVIAQITNEVQARLEQFFEPAVGGLSIARAWGAAGQLAIEEPSRIDQLVAPLMREYPQISAVLVADERGREHMLMRTGGLWQSRETRVGEWGKRTRWSEWRDGAPRTEEWREVEYDPRFRPWYRGAAALEGVTYWTEPHLSFTSREPSITASVTFDRGDGILRVLAFDLLLRDLSQFTMALGSDRLGKVFVVTEDMRLVGLPETAPGAGAEANEAALLEPAAEAGLAMVAAVTEALGEADIDAAPRRFRVGRAAWWGAVRTFELGSWRALRIVVAVPEAELLGNVGHIRLWIVGATLLVIGFAAWRATRLARAVSQPVEALARESDRIGQGDLERGEPVESPLVEVRLLARAHDRMRGALRTLLKLERDLQLARQIQQSTFPERLPRLADFELAAWSEPAEETGGDTYDLVGARRAETGDVLVVEEDPERVVMLLADATGHGIGPALSVTQVRAMLRMAVRMGASLEAIVRHLNEQLYEDLTGGRFITMWLGELSVDTHSLRAFSAGQAPLLHYLAASGEVRILDADAPPLGVIDGWDASARTEITFEPGDLYAAISDGIFEAQDPAGRMFGIDRVVETFTSHAHAGPQAVLERLRARVLEFANGAPPDDDRTAILLGRR